LLDEISLMAVMPPVTLRAKVFRKDVHDSFIELPVVFTEDGPLLPLIDYMLKFEQRSASWRAKLAQGICLLIEYMQVNSHCFDDPAELFRGFVTRLSCGTINETGGDPGGLYWLGSSDQVTRHLVQLLSNFFDWTHKKSGTTALNPWREATSAEQRLAWAAWQHQRDRSFLGHTWDRDKAAMAVARARDTLLKRAPLIDHEPVKRFPEDSISDLLWRGFIVPGKQKSPRIEERLNLRDILITMLLHYGGLRVSEPFQLYVHDVMPDPFDAQRAYVRIFHPSDGLAPHDWLDAKGKAIHCIREAYLRGKFGMRPRDQYFHTHSRYAGWKDNALSSSMHFIDVHWFPSWAGGVFMKLWILYMTQRAQLACNHPFAFVTENGDPYSIDTFKHQHGRAVERIGLEAAKALGTTPHGHRHAYGQRCSDLGVNPMVIMKAMHHKSLESQAVYTTPGREKVRQAILEAEKRNELGGGLSAPPDFLSYGFEDVDPLGLLSGKSPKLIRKK